MTSDGHTCYEFNEANQMSKAKECVSTLTIAEYVYDFNGNRMVKKHYKGGTLHDTVTSWSDSYETKVIVGGATENTAYYFANGELIAKKNSDGSKYYYHNDHLGSTTVISNAGGTLVEDTKYDPWGEVKVGGTKSKFLYTGQESDGETGLHYYNARYYDPHIRRFTQPDDIIQNAYKPQSLNRYSYVWNNPLKYIDPTGHAIVYKNGKLISTIGALPLPEKKNTNSSPSQTIASVLNSSSNKADTLSKPISSVSTNNSGYGIRNNINLSDYINALSVKTNNDINSGGIGIQASGALGLVEGGGFTFSSYLVKSKKDGLVLTASAGVEYVPLGASVGVGPSFMVSNGEDAKELSGVDLYGGGSLKWLEGAQVDHSRSIDSLGIWSWSINPQIGAGGDIHIGVSTTAAFDIPGF